MKSLAFLLGLLVFTSAGAKTKAPTVTTSEAFKLATSTEVVEWIKQNPTTIHLYDANNEKTRKSEGVVHGAALLKSSSSYDVTQTLPADKNAKLIFYCSNEKCTASHDAAKRAIAAGYKDVSVMSDGIKGWKKSGNPVDRI